MLSIINNLIAADDVQLVRSVATILCRGADSVPVEIELIADRSRILFAIDVSIDPTPRKVTILSDNISIGRNGMERLLRDPQFEKLRGALFASEYISSNSVCGLIVDNVIVVVDAGVGADTTRDVWCGVSEGRGTNNAKYTKIDDCAREIIADICTENTAEALIGMTTPMILRPIPTPEFVIFVGREGSVKVHVADVRRCCGSGVGGISNNVIQLPAELAVIEYLATVIRDERRLRPKFTIAQWAEFVKCAKMIGMELKN